MDADLKRFRAQPLEAQQAEVAAMLASLTNDQLKAALIRNQREAKEGLRTEREALVIVRAVNAEIARRIRARTGL